MNRYRVGAVRGIVALAGLLVLAACNPMPPYNFAPPFSGPSGAKIDADLRGVTVTLANPGETTGRMPSDAAAVPAVWRDALQDAVDKSALFDDDSHRHVSVSVEVTKIDIPDVGIDFQTRVDAHYRLFDRKDGKPLFDRMISSSADVPFEWSLQAQVRRRESINRAVQNNIAGFMNALYERPPAAEARN